MGIIQLLPYRQSTFSRVNPGMLRPTGQPWLQSGPDDAVIWDTPGFKAEAY